MSFDFFLDEKNVLELGARRKIYETVSKYAGCHFREIERKSELSAGTVKYHLHFLTKHSLITLEKEGNNLRYFPKEFKPQNKLLMGLLRQESIRRIILFILINEGCAQESIIASVKLSPSTVSWHIRKLEDAKIIRSEKKGRTKSYLLLSDKNELMNLLITHKESFLDKIVDNVIEMWG